MGAAPVEPAEIPKPATVEREERTPQPAPAALELPEPPTVPPEFLVRPNGTFFDAWLDIPHAFVERRLFDVAYGFDRFFSDERDTQCLRPRSFVRWRNEVRVAQDGRLEFGTTLRADLTLPYLERRLRSLRLVLENAGRSLLEGDPAAVTGTAPGTRGDAVLRYELLKSLRSSVDLGAGVLFALPPGLVARTRYRYARQLGAVALARFALTGFWNTKDRFGTNAALALERPLAGPLLLRWTNGAILSQASHGYEGASELALLYAIDARTGLTLLGSADARTKPEPVVQKWRVATRLRTAFFRRWIFGEVEPEVTWPLDAAGGRRTVAAVILRLELQFEQEPPRREEASEPPKAPPAGGAPATTRCKVES